MSKQRIVIEIQTKEMDDPTLRDMRHEVFTKISQGAQSGTEMGPDATYTFTVTNS